MRWQLARMPFRGESSGVIFHAILDRDPVPPVHLNPALPPKLEDVINKALEKDRNLRYQAAAEMRADLQRLKRDTESGRAVAGKDISGSLRGISRRTFVGCREAGDDRSGAGAAISEETARCFGSCRRRQLCLCLAILAYRLAVPLPPLKVSGYTQITNDGTAKLWPQSSAYTAMATDGSRVYFVESPFLAPVLRQVSALGGETAAIPTSLRVNRIGDISPDRSALLVPAFLAQENEAPLWILPLPTGTPRRLGALSGHDGTWSPDGQHVLYANDRDLILAKTDGTESVKLASAPGFVWWPRWSPDGSHIRFSVYDPPSGSDSLWEMQANGTNLHPLLPGWNNPRAGMLWQLDTRRKIFHLSVHSHRGNSDLGDGDKRQPVPQGRPCQFS